MYVTEVLTWQGLPGVSDQQMIDAVEAMVPDLKQLPGFLLQTLSKDSNGRWLDLYFWQTAEEAHASNELMADKASLGALMSLLDVESITMDVMQPLQASGPSLFKSFKEAV